MRRIKRTRRGVTAMLAMLYLVLFSSLAVGFYAATTTSVQIVGNERRTNRAFLASESGMQFVRYHLATMNIPRDTTPDELFERVYEHLSYTLEDTPNMGTQKVGINTNKTVIRVPNSPSAYIPLDSTGSGFRVTVTKSGQQLVVKATGRDGNVEMARAIEISYAVAQRASAIFNYGVASKSAISMQGNTSIRGATNPAHGSVLSATSSTSTPLVMSGSSAISGDVSIVNPYAGISVGPSSRIAGTSDPTVYKDHVHFGVDEPSFPEVDTSIFLPYVQNTFSPGETTLVNTRIPANSNPKFTGNVTIQGVLYIEAPNKVEFGGNTTIQGVVVVENDAPGDPTANVLDFKGTVSSEPVSTLPDSFGGLRELTGAFVLAPNFAVKFGGNFNTVNGSIIGSEIDFYGNAGGTIKGSVINLDDTSLKLAGNSDIIIESQGTSDYPAGVYFGSNYVPLPGTYREVLP